MRQRRSVNVGALVSAPEEVPSRPRVRMRMFAAIMLVIFCVMALRLWSLQVIDHKQYSAAVNSDAQRTVTLPAPRGLIVDRSDTVLADNKVENELVLTRAVARQHPSIIGKAAALAGVSPSTVRAALTNVEYSPYEPVPVLQNAPASVVQYLDDHQSEFPGITVEQETVRDYPQGGTLGTQVLGYTGPVTATYLKQHPATPQTAQIGKTGVEASEQKYLAGKPGKEELQVTPTGTLVGRGSETKPTQGDTVVTTITSGVQEAAQSALAAVITHDRHTATSGIFPKAPNGAVVVLDSETGQVLALASYPSYSLTEWVGGISTSAYQALQTGCTVATGACPLDDYAIDGLYTPGSTFKLATATVALQDGLITPSTTVDDTGVFDVRTHGLPTCQGVCSFKDATAYDAGIVTVRRAITESDDYFFYTLGLRFWLDRAVYGQTAIQDEAHAYGFGDITGIDLPGEVQGRVDSQAEREKLHEATPTAFPTTSWYAGTNLELAFGQGETVVTPLEEAVAYATFDDGGVRHQPEVVADVVSPSGKVVKSSSPKVTGRVTISPANYQALLSGFEGVTHTPGGTAYGTFQADSHVPSTYMIAGKTGTATTGTTHVKAPNALFVGFGPIGHTTQYVVAVAVAQAGYGASSAAPAVANIFNYLYAHPPPKTVKLPTAAHQPSLRAAAPKSAAATTTTTTTTSPPPTSAASTGPATATTVPVTATTVPATTTPAPPPPASTAPPPSTTPPSTTPPAATTTPTTTPPATTTPPTTTAPATTTSPPTTASTGASTGAAVRPRGPP